MDNPNWYADFCQWLEDEGFGTLGTNLFRAQLPPDHNPATVSVVVTPTGGQLSLENGVKRPRVQLLTRCTSWDTAFTKANDLNNFLDGKKNIWLGSLPDLTSIQIISAVAPPASLGYDQRQGWQFSANYQIDLGSSCGG